MENRDKQQQPASTYHTKKSGSFHGQLRYERQHRGWSQAYVAEKIGSDPKSVGRWERSEAFPSPYHRYKLLELFGKNAQEMGLIEASEDDRGADVTRQINEQLEYLEEENQIRKQGVSQSEQNNVQKQRFEREKQRLELEKQRLELLEKRLEIQKRGVEYALEAAMRVVDTFQANADETTRTMLIQNLLPTFLQFFSGKGLELTFTEPQDEE